MRKRLRVIFSFALLLLVTVTLVACNNQAKKDAEAVQEAKTALAIGFTSPDTANSVTSKLTLPATQGEVAVTWVSNKPTVINNTGDVTRPDDNDEMVELTATLKKGSAEDTKEFIVKVIKKEVVVDPDIALVAAAKAALELGFAGEDTSSSVTQNITLVTTKDGVTVTWASNNTAVISATGTVTRPAANTNVVLTATLTKGAVIDTKAFTVTVLAEEVVETGAKAALIAHYADTLGDSEWFATEDVVLVDTIKGSDGIDYDVTWTVTQGGDYFTKEGEVTLPSYTEGDQTIILKADIEDGSTHNFYFVIQKLEATTEEKINAALDNVTVVPITPSGYQEINFLAVTTTRIDGIDVPVVWTTSDETVMKANGELVAFEDEAEKTVVLTASITYNDVTLTKEIEFLVKGVLTFDSFKDALTVNNYDPTATPVNGTISGEKVKVIGVAFYKDINQGYYVVSEDNMLGFVFGTRNTSTFKEGKLYDIMFTVATYYGTFQLNNVSFSNERDGDLPTVTPEDMTLEEYVSMVKPSATTPSQHTLFNLRNVEVRVLNPNDNYQTFFVPIGLPAETPLTDENSIMIYYQSNLNVIKTLNGVKIDSIEVINNGYRTNNIVWNVNFIGTLDDINLILTDQESVDTAIAGFESSINYTYYKAATLNLDPSANLGVNVVWETTDDEIIPVTGENKGVITLPGVQTEVTLTATVTKGEGEDLVTETFERTILVGPLTLSTIADVKASPVTTQRSLMITGVITGIAANRTYTITDESGSMVVYATSSAVYEIGREYTITGTRSLFGGLIQLTQTEAAIPGDVETLPDAVELDEEDLNSETLINHQGELISIEGAIVTAVAVDNFGNITLTLKVGTAEIQLKWDSRVSIPFTAEANLKLVKKDDVIDIVAAPLGWASDNPLIGYNIDTQVVRPIPESDQDKVEEAAAYLDFVSEIEDDTELELPATGLHGVAITWESSHPAIISNTGVVTLPFVTTEVILTATFTLGEGTKEVEIKINVKVGDAITVAMARQEAIGEDVIVTGIVTGIEGTKYVFISDPTGTTIVLYFPTLPEGLAVGDSVLVSGTVAIYNGLVQLTSATMEIISSDNDLPEIIILDGELPVLTAADQGKRYTINNLWVVSYASRNLVVTDGITTITARIDNPDEEELITKAGTAVNKMVNLVNVHVGWFNGAQFFLFEEANIVVVEPTNADKVARDKELLVLAEIYTTEFELPTEGAKGSTITWDADPSSSLVDGKLVIPEEGEVEVVLTATLTLGDVTEIKEFSIILKFTEEITVTMINPGGATVTTNGSTNYANDLGLDPELFTVKFANGGSSTWTAIRIDGGWRMYYHASGGNFMTVTMAEGYIIESIVLEISTNKNDGSAITFRVNDVTQTETGIVGNQFNNDGLGTNWRVLDPIDVNSNSFVLQNMNTENVQLWVWSIKITYTQE